MFLLSKNERKLMEKFNELVAAFNALSGKIDAVLAKLSAAETASTALPPTAIDGSALQPLIDGVNAAAAKIPA